MKNFMKIEKLGLKFLIFMSLLMVFTGGCRLLQPNSGSSADNLITLPNVPANPLTMIRYKVAWLPTVAIVAASLSVGAIFLGATKMGIACLASSLSAIWMSVTLSQYANVLAIAGLASAVILIIAMIMKVKKSNVSLVKGIQALKGRAVSSKHVSDIVSGFQDNDVKDVVKKIKEKL